IPERREVAMQRFIVVAVARLAEDQGAQGIVAYAARSAKLEVLNDIFGRGARLRGSRRFRLSRRHSLNRRLLRRLRSFRRRLWKILERRWFLRLLRWLLLRWRLLGRLLLRRFRRTRRRLLL